MPPLILIIVCIGIIALIVACGGFDNYKISSDFPKQYYNNGYQLDKAFIYYDYHGNHSKVLGQHHTHTNHGGAHTNHGGAHTNHVNDSNVLGEHHTHYRK